MGMQGGTIWLEADSDNGFEAQTTGTYNDNNVHFVSSVKNGTALNLYVDSESVGSGTGSATLGSATGFGIGNHFNEDLQAQFAGDIAETLVFSSALNSDERSRVESYMAIKYGLTRNGSDDGSTGSIDERDYRAGDGGVIWDYDGQGTTYYNDIFGIGRDDKGDDKWFLDDCVIPRFDDGALSMSCVSETPLRQLLDRCASSL